MKMSGNIKNDSTYRMAYYAVSPLPDTNARSPAITVRPASTALLTIDSEDRYQDYLDARENPTSPYNFSIRKNENLMAGFFTRLAVTEVNFPWTIPNINLKTYTIQISFDVGGALTALQPVAIPLGFYTPARLASELQATIRFLYPASLSAFTMVYGTNGVFTQPQFYYATNVAGTTVSFDPVPYNTSTYAYPPQTKQLFDLLGFRDSNSNLQASASGAFTLCQPIRYVDIVCNQLTAVSALKDNTSQPIVRDMLCRVYLGDGGGTGQSTVAPDASGFCPPGCAPMTIYRNFTSPKQIQWLPAQNIQGYLQFSVYDDAGDLLSNSIAQGSYNSTDWSFTILVSEN
jgi:hypothetical protein